MAVDARIKEAFTLIELLTVLAIIAILASILLPGLHRAKQAARSTKCKSNVRQLGLALAMHAADFAQYPAYAYDPYDGDSPKETDRWWYDRLFPYTSSHWTNGLYRCPDYRGLTVSGLVRGYDPLGSYGYNANGTRWSQSELGLGGLYATWIPPGTPESDRVSGAHIAESQVRSPSEMIAFGDASLLFTPKHIINNFYHLPGPESINGTGILDPNRYYASFYWGPNTLRVSDQRHGGRFQIAFADGHMESIARLNLFATNDASYARWNNDHEPHRDP